MGGTSEFGVRAIDRRNVPPFGRKGVRRDRVAVVFLLGLTAFTLYLCYLLIAPFIKAILFSFIFAIVFYPAHKRINGRIRNRNGAAAFSTVGLILAIGALCFFVGRALVSGFHDIYVSLSASAETRQSLSVFILHLFAWTIAWAGRFIPISVPDLQAAVLSQIEKALASVLSVTAGLLGGLPSFALNVFIAIFVAFFLFRDGEAMLRRLAVIVPLAPAQAGRLFRLVRETLYAIAYGTLAMAAIQGTLTGLAFWFLGLSTPVVWGLLATVLAALPFVGTTLVWLPAAAMLLVSGHWIKGIMLIIWGLAVVHPVDNLLRPYLIGGRLKLSTVYVFFAVVGGLKAFGLLGLFVGPLILSTTAALFTFQREERRLGDWDLPLHFGSEKETHHPIASMHSSK